jgi:hypothetical protein
MFIPTLIAAIVVLLYMHHVRSFFVLKLGRSYRSRGGSVIKIVSKISTGPISVFVDTNNRRYYSNGEAVDDVGTQNESRLFEMVA